MRGQPVEDVARHRGSAKNASKTYDDGYRYRIEQHDEQAVHCGAEASAGLVLRALEEE